MIGLASVVRISSKARLRFDRHSQKHMLLYPERGLLLSDSAADVLALCTEARSVSAIVETLVNKYGETSRDKIALDVVDVLKSLADRGLIDEVLP
jgi:coenzyme PQQ biosynthesis protein PqqD